MHNNVHQSEAAQWTFASIRSNVSICNPYNWPSAVDWHKGCNVQIRYTLNVWTAPSVNDDRLAGQVMGNMGVSGRKIRL